ncbi:hypothetical protein SAMN02745172_03907 [Pseudoxanthobacter soli DSM 19599]|uniref:Uncharacterized protein n=2 Tax=Pseudoxanthobacter TaxID=433838 RepID=A0A1M7ZQQ4_9HYPH|nr:hypothetical protein SAMN02745172_03907 [Pseudoxanthobacter soli DSM 19599]
MQPSNTTRFEAVDTDGKPMQFTVGTEIMDYIEPARTFGREDLADLSAKGRFQPRVIAIPDQRQQPLAPMVLTLGNRNRLSLVRRTAGGAAESASWESIDLSAGLATMADGPVQAFGAAWTEDDRMTVAVAVGTGDGGRQSHVFVAYDLDSRTTDWSAISWVDYGRRGGLAVDAIRVLRDGRGVWTVVLSAGDDRQNAYLIRSDLPRSFADGALVFSVATDLERISDFQVGGLERRGVLHVLGAATRRGEGTLFARPLPLLVQAGNPETTSVYTFRCPDGAKVLALGLDRPAVGADLYIGGNGVHRIPATQFLYQEDADIEMVISPSIADRVQRLLVTESPDGAATAWALLEDGRLVTVPRAGPNADWGTPLVLRDDVVEIAPTHGDGALTGSVLVVYGRGRAAHLWRDAAGIWQEMDISVADPQEAAAITCFATNLGVCDGAGVPLPAVRVRVRASVPSCLVINGRSYAVGPDRAATVTTGLQGSVTIFNRAVSFSPATYRIEVDGLAASLDINPGAALYRRFGTITAEDLRKAKDGSGTGYLLGDDYRSGGQTAAVDSFVTALRQAATLATATDGAVPGVRLVKADAPFSSEISAAALPDGYGWGVAGDGKGGLQTVTGRDAVHLSVEAASGGAAFQRLGSSLSDLFEGLWNNIKDAVSFVVRKVGDVVEFVCTIAGKVKSFVLSTLEEIGGFFKWAWGGIKTGVEKAWNFLKFLFDWDDIIAVRNKLADMIDADLVAIRRQVLNLKTVVGPAFDTALSAIRAKGAEFGVRPSDRSVLAPGAGTIARAQKPGGVKDEVLGGGPGAWVMDQLSSLGRQIIDIELPPSDESADIFTRLAEEQLENLAALSKDLGRDFSEIFGDRGFSLADLDVEKIQKIVIAVCIRIAEAATAAMKSVVLALIDVLAGLIGAFRDILFMRIRVPFIAKLIKLATGKTVDVSARLIDIALLPPAILTTVTYKIVFGQAPIGEVVKGTLPAVNIPTAQSGDLVNKLWFIKDVGATYASFVSIMLDAPAALTPVPAQQLATKLQWFSWGLGFVGHIAGTNPLTNSKATPGLTRSCQELIFVAGLIQYGVRYEKLKTVMTPPAYQSFVMIQAGVESVCYGLQLFTAIVGYVADDDSRDGLALVQFCGRTASQGVMQACRLVEEPETKSSMIVGAMAANLFLNLGVGVYRQAVAHRSGGQ